MEIGLHVLRLPLVALADVVAIVTTVNALDYRDEEIAAASSNSCLFRCAMFVRKKLKPKCQCDGLCTHSNDCCTDYRDLCQTKTVPKVDHYLVEWVGITVGIVFTVVLVMATAYYLAMRRRQFRRQSKVEQEEAMILSRAFSQGFHFGSAELESPTPSEKMIPLDGDVDPSLGENGKEAQMIHITSSAPVDIQGMNLLLDPGTKGTGGESAMPATAVDIAEKK